MPSTWLLLLLVGAARARASDAQEQLALATTTSAYAHAWTTSDSLREGRGRGYCLAAKRPTRARISIKRRGHVEKGGWLGGPRDHCYVLAFALDDNRALAFKRDGAPCIASIRKLRLDSSDEELVLDDIALKAGSTVHVYIASNRLSGSCAYDVRAESDAELEELPEPTGGYRGVRDQPEDVGRARAVRGRRRRARRGTSRRAGGVRAGDADLY